MLESGKFDMYVQSTQRLRSVVEVVPVGTGADPVVVCSGCEKKASKAVKGSQRRGDAGGGHADDTEPWLRTGRARESKHSREGAQHAS